MAGLLNNMQELKRRQTGPKCRVHMIMDALDDEDKAALTAAIADPFVAASTLAKHLRASGYSITDNTIGRHRRGECACAYRQDEA